MTVILIWLNSIFPPLSRIQSYSGKKKEERGKGRGDTFLELVYFVEEIISVDSSDVLFAVCMHLLVENNN